ncbi:MAG: D-hexose-6-phosphate mutarotase [Phycisphaeraceae bacterium]|nr:D-hexose-6-phosphate mutarotase [Phycisphaeraceae bacterium]
MPHTPHDPASLRRRFALPNALDFDAGQGGLTRALLTSPHATAEVYLHGAHVTQFQPSGQAPVMFLSRQSRFEPGKPIRGGVPICMPWFSDTHPQKAAPKHGFVRIEPWSVASSRQPDADSVELVLTFHYPGAPASGLETKYGPFWPHALDARLTVTLAADLNIRLEVTNKGKQPFELAEALHTYFAVGDVRQASVLGLENLSYEDHVGPMTIRQQGTAPIHFRGETDRIYLRTPSVCTLEDPVLKRRVIIRNTGSDATVVWNPWSDRAKALPDLADDEWTQMLCVETANVAGHKVRLAPGATHAMSVELEVVPH